MITLLLLIILALVFPSLMRAGITIALTGLTLVLFVLVVSWGIF